MPDISGSLRVYANGANLIAVGFPGYDSEPKPAITKLRRPGAFYILQQLPGGCSANCAYCNQSRSSQTNTGEKAELCNYEWPLVDLGALLQHIRSLGKRSDTLAFCIQTIFHKDSFENQVAITRKIREVFPELWITTATTPRTREELAALKGAGVNSVCLCFEAATFELFDRIKGHGVHGPYRWAQHHQALKDALELFPDATMTHLMIGLGETELEAFEFIASMLEMGARVSLFPYLPIAGTPFADDLPKGAGRPPKPKWRRLQLARYLLADVGLARHKVQLSDERIIGFDMPYDEFRRHLPIAFLHSGCKFCRRAGYAEDQDLFSPDYDLTIEPYVFLVPQVPKVIEKIIREMDLQAPSPSHQ